MRKFYLQKETGERIGLNNESGILFTDPSGLGLEFDNSFNDLEEGFFNLIAKKHTQKIITGKINFVSSPYETYTKFINWCMSAKKLRFIYSPSGREYYIDAEISSLSKGELNKYGILQCQIDIRYLSPWFLPSPLVITFRSDEITPFTWDQSKLDGPDILVSSFGDEYSAEIEPSGHLPGALEIEFNGVAENPEFLLIGMESGTVYGDCEIDGDFSAGQKLLISTAYGDSYVKKIDGDTETDLLRYVNLAKEPFFKIPLDEPCILRMIDSGSLSGKLSAKAYFYYRSV